MQSMCVAVGALNQYVYRPTVSVAHLPRVVGPTQTDDMGTKCLISECLISPITLFVLSRAYMPTSPTIPAKATFPSILHTFVRN